MGVLGKPSLLCLVALWLSFGLALTLPSPKFLDFRETIRKSRLGFAGKMKFHF